MDELTDDDKIALGWRGPLVERWAAENGVPMRRVALTVLAEEDVLGLPRALTDGDVTDLKAGGDR